MQTKMLKFGGPGLPPGTHTFYESRDAEGRAVFVDRVEAGHEVDAANVLKLADNDPAHDINVAEGYVERGQASYVEPGEPSAEPAEASEPPEEVKD